MRKDKFHKTLTRSLKHIVVVSSFLKHPIEQNSEIPSYWNEWECITERKLLLKGNLWIKQYHPFMHWLISPLRGTHLQQSLFEKWSTLDPKHFYAIPFQKLVFLVSLYPEFLEKKKRNKTKLVKFWSILGVFVSPSMLI